MSGHGLDCWRYLVKEDKWMNLSEVNEGMRYSVTFHTSTGFVYCEKDSNSVVHSMDGKIFSKLPSKLQLDDVCSVTVEGKERYLYGASGKSVFFIKYFAIIGRGAQIQ
jgi:hypothetical protein